MRSFPGNPYDGHTLGPALEQVEILTDQSPDLAVVDRGYRGHATDKTRVLISGTRRGLTPKLIADLRGRSAIEPEIRHMKSDGRLARCPLKGTIGDALFAVRCGAVRCGAAAAAAKAPERSWPTSGLFWLSSLRLSWRPADPTRPTRISRWQLDRVVQVRLSKLRGLRRKSYFWPLASGLWPLASGLRPTGSGVRSAREYSCQDEGGLSFILAKVFRGV